MIPQTVRFTDIHLYVQKPRTDKQSRVQVIIIDADSVGAMGAIIPTAKKLWGQCTKVALQEMEFYVAVVHSKKIH